MEKYKLQYKEQDDSGCIQTEWCSVTDEGILLYGVGLKGHSLRPSAEWVITHPPTESTQRDSSFEDAEYTLFYDTAGQQETIGVEEYVEEDDGTLSFQQPNGKHGRLDRSAEWHVEEISSPLNDSEENRVEPKCDSKSDQNTLPSNWDKIRKQAYEKDAYTCQYCGVRGWQRGDVELHAHHIIPKQYGGVHSLHNLMTLCRKCHHAAHGQRVAPELE